MLDTTVDKSEAPADYAAELSKAHGGVIVLMVFLGLIGALGWWLTGGPGFWPGVGWTLMGVVALVEVVLLRDLVRLRGDRSEPAVRKIESAVRCPYVYAGRELSPDENGADRRLVERGRAHRQLVLEDGSKWLLTRDQLRRLTLAKHARLWVAPSSGKLILLEVIEK